MAELLADVEGVILPNDPVTDLEVEGFFLPGVHA